MCPILRMFLFDRHLVLERGYMKKFLIILLCCILFLFACEKTDKKDNKENLVSGSSIYNTSTTSSISVTEGVPGLGVAVSSINSTLLKKNKINWEVTDLRGNKRKLKLSGMDLLEHKVVKMSLLDHVTEYYQVENDNYYYMKQNGIEYSIYKNKGELVGKFNVNKGSVAGCVKYGDHFYINIGIKERYQQYLALVNLNREKVDIIYEYPYEEFKYEVSFFNNRIYIMDDSDNSVDELELTGKKVRKIKGNQKNRNIDLHPIQYIMDNKIYMQGVREGKDIVFYREIIGEKQKEEVFRYSYDSAGKDEWEIEYAFLEMKHNHIYIWELYYDGGVSYTAKLYVISPKDKKMRNVSDGYVSSYFATDKYVIYADEKDILHSLNIQSFEEKIIPYKKIENYEVYKQYVFYIDKKKRIYRYDLKTQKDVMLSDIKVMDIKHTKEGLYVRKYNEILAELQESEYDIIGDSSCGLYFMDFDGKNIVKIEDEKIEME